MVIPELCVGVDQCFDVVDRWRLWNGPKGYDTETTGPSIRFSKGTGPDPYRARITGFSLSWDTHKTYIALDHADLSVASDTQDELLLEIACELAMPSGRVWAHDYRYELQVLRNHGFAVATSDQLCDSLVAAWLAGWRKKLKTQELKLKKLAQLLGLPTHGTFNDVAKKRQTRDIPAAELAPYAAHDAWLACEVGERAYKELVEWGLDKHFHSLDMPLVEVCRAMGEWGLDVDWDRLLNLGEIWGAEAARIAAEFKAMSVCEVDIEVERSLPTGEFFKNGKPKFKKQPVTERAHLGADIGNDRLFSRWVFDELKWLPVDPTWKRNDNGVFGVGAEILKTLVPTCEEGRKAVEMRLRYQGLSKLRSTYVVGLKELSDQYGDGRLHPSYNVHGTDTQRFSSANPNGQNLPNGSDEAKLFNECLHAPEGWEGFETDLSQIELRLMAHYSGDEGLVQTYQFGEDIHAATMERVGCDRRPAKVLNFSSMYRISGKTLARKLAVQLKRVVPESEGKEFVQKMTRVAYPGVPRYWTKAMEYAQKHGYCKTIDGYKFPVDGKLYKTKWGKMEMLWQEGQTAINTPIQGSAAGIIKTAMVYLHNQWRRDAVWGEKVRILAQIHDSLRVIARPEFRAQAQKDVEYAMCHLVKLRVPVEVETKPWGMGEKK